MNITDFLNIVMITMLFFLSFLCFFLYFGYRKERYYLYFALHQFSGAIFRILSSKVFCTIFSLPYLFIKTPQELGYSLYILMVLVFTFWGSATFYFFIKYLFAAMGKKHTHYFYIIASLWHSLHLPVATIFFIIDKNHIYNMYGAPIIYLSGIILFISSLIKILIVSRKDAIITISIGAIFINIIGVAATVFAMLQKSVSITMIGYLLNTAAYFMYGYTLVLKANRDKKELNDLKDSLEKQVTRRTEELVNARDALIEKDREKSLFFIKLAHETRTPLTLISNYLDAYIADTGQDDRLTVVKDNIDKLIKDMVSFLDYEKLDQGNIMYDHSTLINFSDFLCKKLAMVKEVFWRKKKIMVKHMVTDSLNVRADSRTLDKILNNLLENAFKYSKKEGGIIDVTLSRENQHVYLSIKDNGIGIPAHDLEQIFKPFYQVNPGKAGLSGMGVGLFIVKRIIDDLGGTIEVASRPGVETIFTIRLLESHMAPISHNDFEPDMPGVITVSHAPLMNSEFVEGRPVILLVEDNEDMTYFLVSGLQDEFNVHFARNGNEALNLLDSIVKPDLIISDVMMDGMDGFDFMDELRQRETFNDVPLLFLTARSDMAARRSGLSKGAIAYIHKPFNIEELIIQVKSIMQQRRLIMSSKYENSQHEKLEVICDNSGITPREKEVLELVIIGKEDKEISVELKISKFTVNAHLRSIYKKLSVHNRLELANLFK